MVSQLKKIAIIILLPITVACFSLRHFPSETIFFDGNCTVSLENSTDYYAGWEKTVPHVLALIVNECTVISSVVAVLTVICILSIFRVKSHIEYCGKKMVRAIMLQFRPD